MLDIKFVRENKKLIEKNLVERGINNIDINSLFSLDSKRKELLIKLDDLRKKKRIMTQSIERAAITHKKCDYKSIEEIKGLNIPIRSYEKEIASYEQKIKDLLSGLPNILHPLVPEGLPGEPNKIIRKWGKSPKFNFSPRTYLEIGEKLDIIDFPKSSPILGFEVVFYKGIGAKLQRALINFLTNLHTEKKYIELSPPVMAEGWPILKLLQNRIFDEEELPLGYVAYSLCFRKDWDFARDLKDNLRRVVQFDSIDLVRIVKPEDSDVTLENMVREAEEILKLLGLPYEVAIFTMGNLDYIASKAYSIKIFLPGLDIFIEVSVCSNLNDFFSRDIGILYRNKDVGDKKHVHILSAKNLIIPKAMMAILENFQQADGSVTIPKVLRPYLNGLDRIKLTNEKS